MQNRFYICQKRITGTHKLKINKNTIFVGYESTVQLGEDVDALAPLEEVRAYGLYFKKHFF